MSGLINNGLPAITLFTGSELANLDTLIGQGVAPQSAATSLVALSVALRALSQPLSKTMVASTRYYVNTVVGSPTLITGVSVHVGGTGGTDNWIVELHNASGAIVATSALAGTLAGTANSFQRIPFTVPYQAAAGTYYIVLQSNGTTATFGAYSSPGLPLVTGSAAGTFGTSAAITPPTTYTANLGPVALLY